jgi:hypothetical protein
LKRKDVKTNEVGYRLFECNDKKKILKRRAGMWNAGQKNFEQDQSKILVDGKNGSEERLSKDVSRAKNAISGVGLWTWWSVRGRLR